MVNGHMLPARGGSSDGNSSALPLTAEAWVHHDDYSAGRPYIVSLL